MNAKDGSRILDWKHIKDVIALWTELERDALHIYAALLGQVAAAFVLRRSLAHPAPWLFVLALAVGNEALDMRGDRVVEQWEWDAALHDLWNTMLLPSLLLLLARFAPALVAPRREAPPAGSDEGGA